MGEISLARIDSRLASGQVVKDWCEKYGLKKVIIANDRTAEDPIRIEVMDLTIPEEIESTYLKVAGVKDFLDKNEGAYFLLVETTCDLEKILDVGVSIKEVNVGIIHLSISTPDHFRAFRRFSRAPSTNLVLSVSSILKSIFPPVCLAYR